MTNSFTNPDIIAVLFFLVATLGYDWITRYGPMKNNNISAGVHVERKLWINTMICRENRMVDMIILSNLSQGNAFFASTAIVIVGALATTLGYGSQLNSILDHVPFAAMTDQFIVNCKIIFLMIIFLVAFFKFAWAYRITHYTSIMMGAIPILKDDNHDLCHKHGARVAEMAGLAGNHANTGLHTYYYGIAACGWLINPYIFMAATAIVVIVLYRREYHSKGHDIISGKICP